MNIKLNNIEENGEIGIDLLRLFLGVALIGKGVYFLNNLNVLSELTN